jgi:hypothetical protein
MAVSDRELTWLRACGSQLIELPEDVFAELLTRLPQLLSVSSRTIADEYVESVAKERSLEESVVRAGMAWLTLSAQAVIGESAEHARERFGDLLEEGTGSEVYRDRLERVIEAALANSSSIQSAMQRKTSVKGLLPYYDGVNATIELRAVMDELALGLGHLGHGGARIVDLEPIASIRIAFDSGFPGEAIFQAGKEDVARMVASFSELLERMDEIESFSKGQR